MNISSINCLGNVSNSYLKNNTKYNSIALREDEPDTFTPSFKAVKMAKLASPKKAIALGTMLGLSTLLGCNKEHEIKIDYIDDICMCISTDYTQYSRDLVNRIPEEDKYGRAAYMEWYNANLEVELIDPDCCRHIMPVDPEWDQKCEDWINNYLSGNEICEED